jgi:prevent-host-death family protein
MTAAPIGAPGDPDADLSQGQVPDRAVPVTDARTRFPDLVNRAEYRDEVTPISRRGRGVVAAVVPWSVVEAAARWEDLRLGRLADAVRRADRESGEPPVPLDQLVEEPDAESDA